jgi:hypothetical protein
MGEEPTMNKALVVSYPLPPWGVIFQKDKSIDALTL